MSFTGTPPRSNQDTMPSQPSTSKMNRLPPASTRIFVDRRSIDPRPSMAPSRNTHTQDAGPSQTPASKLLRLPPAASLTPSAMKRRIQDKSRALPTSKRLRQDDLSTSFTHVIPGIINYSHSIWGPSREGENSKEVIVPAQLQMKKARVQQNDRHSNCPSRNDDEIGDVEIESAEADIGEQPAVAQQEVTKETRSQVSRCYSRENHI